MAFDLVIRGGQVVDGTGAPPVAADVAIQNGRVVEIGTPDASGAEELDASGCWVTPGFVDPHTHLDAQLCWDGAASPSNRHGVTTVVLGLCGFGVAPCPEAGDEYLLRMLEVVEEIPYRSTRAGVPFGWHHWSEFRAHLADRPLGVNATGFVPHSALRYFVMGERARGEVATDDDVAQMVAELERALASGAIGFSTSRGPNHVDGFREPVPSRFATDEELRRLVAACRGRLWQINVETKFDHDTKALRAEVDTYARWSREAGATLTWTPLHAEPGEALWSDMLAHNRQLNRGDAVVRPQITAVPITVMLRFDERSVLVGVPGWRDALPGFYKLDPADRIARLRDPEARETIKAGQPEPRNPLSPDYARWRFAITPSRPALAGRTLDAVAAEEGLHPVDLLCEQVIADELATLIELPVANRSADGALRFLEDDQMLLGLGDSGAHVTSVTNYRYPTYLLAELVRDRGALPLETAVQRMTQAPARLHGLRDRGVLAPGGAADLCVIDPERLALAPAELRSDLPGDAPRLFQTGLGYRAVLCNGTATLRDDTPTGAAPGRML